MSVDPIGSQAARAYELQQLQRRGLKSQSVPASPHVVEPQDEVILSEEALSRTAAEKAVTEASDVREERVAELKARIAGGKYVVDPRTLAEDILRHEQDS